jgi:hypothetical protein
MRIFFEFMARDSKEDYKAFWQPKLDALPPLARTEAQQKVVAEAIDKLAGVLRENTDAIKREKSVYP